MNKITSCLVVAFLAASSVAFGDEMPEVKLCTYINGGLNLVVLSNDFTAVTAGISGDNRADYSRVAFEVQVKEKGSDDSTYEPVLGSLPNYTVSNLSEQYGAGAYFIWQSASAGLKPGAFTVRARAAAGEVTTDWSVCGDVVVDTVPSGVPIYPANTDNRFKGFEDGRIATFFENSDSSIAVYAGRAFERPQVLTGVRYIHRNGWGARAVGAVFEVADDVDFTENVRTLHTIEESPEGFKVYSIEFPEPVSCRAARVRVPSGKCCNFCEVEWYGESLVATATEDDSMTPVLSWSEGNEEVVSSQLQVSSKANGPWTALGEAKPGSGNSYSVTNENALLGMPLYYRVAKTLSDETVRYSSTVAFTRYRRLDRSFQDETKLLAGNSPLNAGQFAEERVISSGTDVSNGSVEWCRKAFDGDFSTAGDVFYRLSSEPCETIMGLALAEPCHIVAVEARPRTTVPSRQSYMSIMAATSSAAFEQHNLTMISPEQATSVATWYRYDSTDTMTHFTHVFGYCDSEDVGKAWYGNTSEIRIYGWSVSDEVATGLVVATPIVTAPSPEDLVQSVSWEVYDTGYISETQLEYAYQAEGPWTPMGEVVTTFGAITNRLEDALTGVETFYRVRYTTTDGVFYTDAVSACRCRCLERDALASTSLRSGVETLPINLYEPSYENPTYIRFEGALSNAFDARLDNYVDAYYMQFPLADGSKKDYVGFNAVVGLKFPEPSHVADVWVYPRSNSKTTAERLNYIVCYGAKSEEDLAATNLVVLSAQQSTTQTNTWKRYPSSDSARAYPYVLFYGNPALSANLQNWNGDMTEMYVFGWSDADTIASGAVIAPTDFRKASGSFVWTAVQNAEKYDLEYWDASTESWSVAASGIAGSSASCVDATARAAGTYQYRLKVYGLDGKMIRTSEAIEVIITGFTVIIR